MISGQNIPQLKLITDESIRDKSSSSKKETPGHVKEKTSNLKIQWPFNDFKVIIVNIMPKLLSF